MWNGALFGPDMKVKMKILNISKTSSKFGDLKFQIKLKLVSKMCSSSLEVYLNLWGLTKNYKELCRFSKFHSF